jgi:hypothetical protein
VHTPLLPDSPPPPFHFAVLVAKHHGSGHYLPAPWVGFHSLPLLPFAGRHLVAALAEQSTPPTVGTLGTGCPHCRSPPFAPTSLSSSGFHTALFVASTSHLGTGAFVLSQHSSSIVALLFLISHLCVAPFIAAHLCVHTCATHSPTAFVQHTTRTVPSSACVCYATEVLLRPRRLLLPLHVLLPLLLLPSPLPLLMLVRDSLLQRAVELPGAQHLLHVVPLPLSPLLFSLLLAAAAAAAATAAPPHCRTPPDFGLRTYTCFCFYLYRPPITLTNMPTKELVGFLTPTGDFVWTGARAQPGPGSALAAPAAARAAAVMCGTQCARSDLHRSPSCNVCTVVWPYLTQP